MTPDSVSAGIVPDPTLPRPVAAVIARARRSAEAMLGHVRAQAWGGATEAFTAFEAALVEAQADR